MGRKVDLVAKAVSGNSGNASNGKFTCTGVSKQLRGLTDRKDSKAPKNRG